MARRLFTFDAPDRFVAGAIGPPGERVFYLQAREGRAVVSVSLEKAQVAALALRLEQLLAVLDGEAGTPPARRAEVDRAPLDEPLVEVFHAGPMALSWDPAASRVTVEAQPMADDAEFVEVADDDPDGPDLLRVRVTPEAARGFVSRAEEVLRSGRPTCPFCGQPLEPTGHFCPQRNGHPA